MKIIAVTAVLSAFGVLSVSSADSSSKCQTGNVIANTLYSFNGTVGATLDALGGSVGKLNNVAQNVTDGSVQLVNNAIGGFIGNILDTVANVNGVDKDKLKQNCTQATQDYDDLITEARNLITKCATEFTAPALSAIDSVQSNATSLIATIGSAITSAETECTSASALLGCVQTYIGDIPDKSNSLTTDALTAQLKVEGLDTQSAITKCGSDAVGAVLGNACNSLSDLQTCAKNLASQ